MFFFMDGHDGLGFSTQGVFDGLAEFLERLTRHVRARGLMGV